MANVRGGNSRRKNLTISVCVLSWSMALLGAVFGTLIPNVTMNEMYTTVSGNWVYRTRFLMFMSVVTEGHYYGNEPGTTRAGSSERHPCRPASR
ncbi:MAG: hypothetical protein IJ737_02870 [Ruminococcus sp.]|nr:hypothetical protein [Ruminococcus sp.]